MDQIDSSFKDGCCTLLTHLSSSHHQSYLLSTTRTVIKHKHLKLAYLGTRTRHSNKREGR